MSYLPLKASIGGVWQAIGADSAATILLAGGSPQSTYSANTPIVYPTIFVDSASGYDVTTGQYTVPSTGIYSVTAASGSNITNNAESHVYVNNSLINGLVAVSLGGGDLPSGTILLAVNAGDLIDVRVNQNWGAVNAGNCAMSIFKVS